MSEFRQATCEGKRAYDSPAEAEKHAKHARKKRDVRLRSYKCPHCNSWHLTDVKSVKRRPSS